MARNPSSLPNPARIADEQHSCLELKRKGMSVRAIAAALKMTPSTVQGRLQAAFAELVLPAAEEVRKLDLERVDSYLKRLEDRLEQGEDPVRVIPIALKALERRAKLTGADAPILVDATVTETTQQDLELQEMLRDAKAAQAADEARLRATP